MIEAYPSNNSSEGSEALPPISPVENISIDNEVTVPIAEMGQPPQLADADLANEDADFSKNQVDISDSNEDMPQIGRLLTPLEVAKMFRVDAKTVSRWARLGKLPCIKTLGGHRRFYEKDVENLIITHSTPNNNPHN